METISQRDRTSTTQSHPKTLIEFFALGEILDGFGGYHTYGLAENYAKAARANLLPMGIAQGSRVLRTIAKDQILTREDVVVPEGRLCDRLRQEQDTLFST
jgi:predicted homoserine dehydrogenase-like protein